jgi:hypothetical protein
MLFTSPFYEFIYCPDNFRRWVTITALNVALGGVTAVINMLLELYSRWAVKQEVHGDRTSSQASLAQAQFSAQFLNTVAVGVRYCRLPGIFWMHWCKQLIGSVRIASLSECQFLEVCWRALSF